MIKTLFVSLCCLGAATLGSAAWAQDATSPPNAAAVPPPVKADPKKDPAADAKKVARKIPATLMFTIDELNEIQSRMASAGADAQAAEKADAIENATLFLSTIVYYGPKDWTIWVNGKPIGPGQEFQSFKVTEIGPRYVELLVPLSAQGMRPVRLEPNQTFIAKSGAVVEGAWTR